MLEDFEEELHGLKENREDQSSPTDYQGRTIKN